MKMNVAISHRSEVTPSAGSIAAPVIANVVPPNGRLDRALPLFGLIDATAVQNLLSLAGDGKDPIGETGNEGSEA